MYVQVQHTDEAAVDCSLPAFACAGIALCVALHLKAIYEKLVRKRSPI